MIDVSNGDQTFTFDASFIDDLSSNVRIQLGWSSPNGEHRVNAYLDPNSFNNRYGLNPGNSELIIEGNETNYKNFELTIHQHSEPGTWTLSNIGFWDKANNGNSYYSGFGADELNKLGLDLDFEVINNNAVDLTPPSLQSLELSKQVLDVSEGDQTFTYDVSIFDNLSGFGKDYRNDQYIFQWKSPSGKQWIWSSPYIRDELEMDYGENYEMYINNNVVSFESVEVIIPQYSEPGTYALEMLVLTDGIGNDIDLDYEDIQNLGFSTEFEVINANVDTTPPELKRFELSEDKFDVSYGDATADVTFQFTDDKSGLDHYTQFTWINENGDYIHWNTANNIGPALTGPQYSFPDITPGESILIKFSELVEGFTDPEGDSLFPFEFGQSMDIKRL